ncbi:type 1 glutamine amidotransferase domain-containing protein [Arenibaculum pallidiluteum]|uniref:type 1 glutamine amidotransferase domain-containing protein n=1 Tax=Arenibaculum pallidiluteum TaxID=2812559 RepID=UPI001A964B2F|nr:type 1 glutamine amidotransferase domain-containing protein [Arenibaculum pallidiluteum]
MAAKRVLIITTSHAEMGSSGKRTGLWLEELSTPYYALKDAGLDVTLASIAGGEIPFDPASLPAPAAKPGEEPAGGQEVPESVRRFLADEDAMRLARTSASIHQLAGLGFDALFMPGGHGTMWDYPGNEKLAEMIVTADEEGKVVAAVCHGPACLTGVTMRGGRPLVEGRRVTAFTDAEEEAVGLSKVVPFLLESRLRDLGARFESTGPWQPFAVRDGRLVTGQNPQSSELVARHVIEALREQD